MNVVPGVQLAVRKRNSSRLSRRGNSARTWVFAHMPVKTFSRFSPPHNRKTPCHDGSPGITFLEIFSPQSPLRSLLKLMYLYK